MIAFNYGDTFEMIPWWIGTYVVYIKCHVFSQFLTITNMTCFQS